MLANISVGGEYYATSKMLELLKMGLDKSTIICYRRFASALALTKDMEEFEQLIEYGPDINPKDTQLIRLSDSCLLKCHNNINKIKVLLNNGADPMLEYGGNERRYPKISFINKITRLLASHKTRLSSLKPTGNVQQNHSTRQICDDAIEKYEQIVKLINCKK